MKAPLFLLPLLILSLPLAHADYYDLAAQEQQQRDAAEKAKQLADEIQFDHQWSDTLVQAANKILRAHPLSGEMQKRFGDPGSDGVSRLDGLLFSTTDNYECAGDHGMPWGGEWHGSYVNCINSVTHKHLQVFVKF